MRLCDLEAGMFEEDCVDFDYYVNVNDPMDPDWEREEAYLDGLYQELWLERVQREIAEDWNVEAE